MDDSEYVCPLCCEELDISDRQFFPCKCGYQVCMWCWHRIRESESGLCPACRTPYGDDPHEFSAVDVEEVLKANKEKEAAAKRERDRQRHEYSHGIGATSSHGSGGSSLDDHYSSLSGPGGPMEVPKDRTQLANMRVIRRNLVYAVGLPPSVANEDTLRKPEYFGQYGKISKIVLNRNQATNSGGDPRRSSCSAYVTFCHKEDTLACILALDGFYLENRNIRASYGTSKYCSAFIKNVRCNNPDCTYLHEMGAVEDTFTKQEIQAGYVTSGRDVLARQQQIVAQALSAASGGGSGSSVRKKSGGGGPSGTGRSSANSTFPPPEFDEPAKPTPNLVPHPAGMVRATTAGTAFSTAAASAPGAAKLARAASAGTGVKPVGATSAASVLAGNRKGILASNGSAPQVPQGATAASVVAGVHTISSTSSEPPAPHTTLTPLTPLKRNIKSTAAGTKATATSSSGPAAGLAADSSITQPELPSAMTSSKGLAPTGQPSMAAVTRQQNDVNKLSVLRSNSGGLKGLKKATVGRSAASHGTIGPAQAPAPVSPSSISSGGPSVTSSGGRLSSLNQSESVVSSLGGEVISSIGRAGPGQHVGAIGSAVGSFGGNVVGSSSLLGDKDVLGGPTPGSLDSLGGEVFTGPLKPATKSAIGSGKDKWSASGAGLAPMPTAFDAGGAGPGALWGSANAGPPTSAPGGAFGGAAVGNVGGVGVAGPPVGVGVPGFGVDSLGGTAGVNVGGFGGVGSIGGIGGVGPVGSAGVVGVGNVGSIFGNAGANGSAVAGGTSIAGTTINTNAGNDAGNISRVGSGIGGGGIIGSHVSGSVLPVDNRFGGAPPSCGSSALASILGINLPTGSGSLRESSSLWNASSAAAPHPPSSLKNGPISPSQGVIGPSSSANNNNALIGGVPIVGGVNQPSAFGGSNKNDIALLQSLLPGVHITSGNESSVGFGAWGSAPGANVGGHQVNPRGGGENWDRGIQAPGSAAVGAVGAVGQNSGQQAQRQGAGNIW